MNLWILNLVLAVLTVAVAGVAIWWPRRRLAYRPRHAARPRPLARARRTAHRLYPLKT